MEDGKSECHIENDTRQPRPNPTVESHDALLFVNLGEAVGEAVEFGGFQTLHLGLDHVHRIVEHGRAETGKGSREKVHYDFVGDFVLEEFFGVSKDHKTDALIGRLFQESGRDTLVNASNTLRLHNRIDPVENVAELGLR